MESGPLFVMKALVMMKLKALVNNLVTQVTAFAMLSLMYMGKIGDMQWLANVASYTTNCRRSASNETACGYQLIIK